MGESGEALSFISYLHEGIKETIMINSKETKAKEVGSALLALAFSLLLICLPEYST